MADLEMLRRLWAAFGCAPNPDDFKAGVQESMWEQVVEFARSSAAQDRSFDRQRREALAEVVCLREQNQRFASRLGGYATTMQDQLDPLFQMLGKLRGLVGDWQANSGSRPLGDPTAATWNGAALQLLRVLDGKDPNHG